MYLVKIKQKRMVEDTLSSDTESSNEYDEKSSIESVQLEALFRTSNDPK